MSLFVKLENVKAGNRNSLLSALTSLSDFDCDFNGENGMDYLWDEVWEANGFESQEDFESQDEETELKYESNLDWIDNYKEENRYNEPLVDVHYENDFEDMIDWQYEDAKPSEMLGKSENINDYPEMLELEYNVIFWYGLV